MKQMSMAMRLVQPIRALLEVKFSGVLYDYLGAGTPLVWVVYPRSKHVVVYTPDGMARTLQVSDVLQNAEVLPGFSMRVAELFE
jgi:Uma2 family endonuclease